MSAALLSLALAASALTHVVAVPTKRNYNNDWNNWDTTTYIGNSNDWTPEFASAGWITVTGTEAVGVSLFYTGSSACHGIQEVAITEGGGGGGGSRKRHYHNDHSGEVYYPVTCFTSSHWGIDTDSAFAVTSVAAPGLSEVRMFYWSPTVDGHATIKDAYWTPAVSHHFSKRANTYGMYDTHDTHGTPSSSSSSSSSSTHHQTSSASSTSSTSSVPTTTSASGTSTSSSSSSSATTTAIPQGVNVANVNSTSANFVSNDYNGGNDYYPTGSWHAGTFSHVVDTPWTDGLAAVSWFNVTTGTLGRRVFYVQGGWLKEMTLLDGTDSEWANQGREGIQLFFNPGDLTATSWVDENNVLRIRVYVLNADTNELVEYDWDSYNFYTSNNDIYAVDTVYTNVAQAAATINIASPNTVSVFATSSQETNGVVEEVTTSAHGSRAAAGSPISTASLALGSDGLTMVFYLDTSGRLRHTVEVYSGSAMFSENLLVHVDLPSKLD
ncbi:hypothetical protein FRB96_001218 [Tulasnella sp. 330]|nr:hypothetical protein FRB96_001218 [Tulasnella sp. 330]KAG8883339.1 hypothetical protein FRB97_006764 [Tulasnella sp. 331]KAG8888708.1 hypothetical protein FRB98_006965 [Tulasnella sp. 332]